MKTFRLLLMPMAAVLGLAILPASSVVSQTTIATPLNNATGSLSSDHLAGSTTLALKSGEGARFGSPTPSAPVRVTVARRPTLVSGRIESTTTQTIFLATGRTGDTLTGVTATEGTTDQRFYKNDPVAALITAGTLTELQTVVTEAATTASDAATIATAAALAVDGKADDAAVVKLTGDQTVSGTKNFVTPVLHDLATNTDLIVDKVIPVPGSQDVTFNRAMATADGNPVMSLGWNIGGAGQRFDPTKPTFRLGFEYDYAVGGEKWMEGHLFAFIDPVTGNETRPLSVVVNKSQDYKVDTLLQGSSWTWQNKGQTFQIAQLNRTADESIYYKITGKNSSDALGYAFSLISDSVTPSDTITIGRKAALNNSVTIQGTTSTALTLSTAGKLNKIADDGGFTFLADPTYLMFFRSNDTVISNRNLSRLAFRATDNGSAMQIGFFGAAPVVKQPANPDTSGATLAALEAEVNELKALIRAYGLMTP